MKGGDKYIRQFIIIPKDLLSKTHKPSLLYLYALLSDKMDYKIRTVNIKLKTLLELSGYDKRTLIKLIAQLSDFKYIQIELQTSTMLRANILSRKKYIKISSELFRAITDICKIDDHRDIKEHGLKLFLYYLDLNDYFSKRGHIKISPSYPKINSEIGICTKYISKLNNIFENHNLIGIEKGGKMIDENGRSVYKNNSYIIFEK